MQATFMSTVGPDDPPSELLQGTKQADLFLIIWRGTNMGGKQMSTPAEDTHHFMDTISTSRIEILQTSMPVNSILVNDYSISSHDMLDHVR